ncbi:hypothetical protein NQZ68_014004 [Dissostichus eleginoides]|nr:hypothetical protein NQZ68_014004 [Dissostichus eleginoides]
MFPLSWGHYAGELQEGRKLRKCSGVFGITRSDGGQSELSARETAPFIQEDREHTWSDRREQFSV